MSEAADPVEELLKVLAIQQRRRTYQRIDYYNAYEYQKRFHNALGFGTQRPAAQRVLLAGNGTGKCVTYQTLIQHPDGTSSMAGELFDKGDAFDVFAWDGKKPVVATVSHLVKKPPEKCYRFYLSNGDWFEAAGEHRILTDSGYEFCQRLLEFLPSHLESNWVSSPLIRGGDVRHLIEKQLDSLRDYLLGSHLYGEQLLCAEGICQEFAPSLNDAQQQHDVLLRSDGSGNKYTNIVQLFCDRLSNIDVRRQDANRHVGFLASILSKAAQLEKCCNREFLRPSIAATSRSLSSDEALRDRKYGGVALLSPFNDGIRIISYIDVGIKDIYDFTVPVFHNYIAAGVVHHNTVCGATETAIHLTGKYPDWWTGTRFRGKIMCMVGGNTNEAVRDICQKSLFGDPNEPNALGSGTVPVNLIGKRTSKPGVPNAYDTVLVRHVTGGWSKVMFRAYEQGPKKHMGHRIDLGWLDEEPPQEIWSQYLRATISTGGILYITFTPESGLTEVVNSFMNNLQKGQALIQASWDDAPHLVKETGELTDEAKQLESGFPAHEREMRRRGVPSYGTGLVFPFTQEQLCIDPIEIPRWWPRIIGIDFGWDHPAGAVMLAWDRDADIVYVTAEYRESRAIPAIHAAAMTPWGDWPVAWPHDGLNTEKGTGDELVKSYTKEGLKMLPWKATNPPLPNQKEGEGGNSVEASILDMFTRMETGRWKVFKTCKYWLEEQRTYHRDEQGKLVKVRDDVLSASRYAHMMLRHARTEVVRRRQQAYAAGATNW